jgi:hypothetical protein
MVKNKQLLYTLCYKLQVIAYAEKHGNRMEERRFGPPPTEKMIMSKMFWKCQVGESELSVGKVQTGQNWKLAY